MIPESFTDSAVRYEGRDELDKGFADMTEFGSRDYEEKLERLKQSREITAAWIVLVLVALFFISLELFFGGA